MDLTRAAARLELSDGEIRCPRKQSVLGIGRCQQLQRETEAEGHPCTCNVYRGRGLPVVVTTRPLEVAPARPAPPPAVPAATPPPGRRSAIAAAAQARAARASRHLQSLPPEQPAPAPVAAEPEPVEPPAAELPIPPPAPPVLPAIEEHPVKPVDILEKMRANPSRQWTLAELAELRGGTKDAVRMYMTRLIASGDVVRLDQGMYSVPAAWVDTTKTEPKAPAGEAPGPMPPAPRAATDAEALRAARKLHWAICGFGDGYLSKAQLMDIAGGVDITSVIS